MAAAEQPVCNFGWRAPDFTLPDADGRLHTLEQLKGANGTLVMFICNHCPYVKAVADRLARDAHALQALGVGVVAIMPNDYETYPDDAPERMKEFARIHGFQFPYLVDRTQQVARAYDAVCTPDFFGFNADLRLQYRGRLDESGRAPASAGARRELFEAMRQVAETGKGPGEQTASIGCSIKWRG
ncbi:MAG: thioredoxin family protein [Rhodospirillales bacterium]|nr:MAG: thioredoxin family protein [Rhodospirillales bacterium]